MGWHFAKQYIRIFIFVAAAAVVIVIFVNMMEYSSKLSPIYVLYLI